MKHFALYLLIFFGGTLTFQSCKVPTDSNLESTTSKTETLPSLSKSDPSTHTKQQIALDTIIWNEHIHDFQTVSSGPPATTKYTFVNKTNKTIKIDRVEVGCSCTASDYSKNEIQPNDTGWISAAYKTANTFGYFRKHVDVFFNNGKSTHLILTGTVDPMITSPK